VVIADRLYSQQFVGVDKEEFVLVGGVLSLHKDGVVVSVVTSPEVD
jgi:hypothetical protein